MKKKGLFICLLLFLGMESSFAQHFYRISGNGLERPSYALGTMHTIPAAYVDSIYGFRAVLEQVEQIACEIDIEELILKLDSIRTAQKDLDSLYMAADKKFMRKDGRMRLFTDELSFEEADRVKWALSHYLGVEDQTLWTPSYILENRVRLYNESLHHLWLSYGYDQKLEGSYQIDNYITIDLAKEHHLPIYTLDEERVPQASIRERENLYSVLRDRKSSRKALAKQLYNEVMGRKYGLESTEQNGGPYLKGSNALPMVSNHGDMSETESRNAIWLPKLTKLMQERPTLIDVGLLHLIDAPGYEGLLHKLKDMGYTVEEVKGE